MNRPAAKHRRAAYPVYKDSGVEWLGEIPEGWKIIRVKSLEGNSANVVQTGPFGAQLHADDYVDEGVPLILIRNVGNMQIDDTNIPMVSQSDAERLSMYCLKKGDIVFSRVGSIGRIALCAERENGWLISGQMLRLRILNPIIHDKFIAHAFGSSSLLIFIELQSVGSTRESINTEILRNMPLPIPSIPEQQTIAAFLDRETSRIDELIAKKERQIELLQEKRSALISHAVTKGLDPNVKMKDSGVEWLGEIPEHWEVKKVKNVVLKIGSGKTPKGGSEVYVDSGIMLIRSQNVHFDGLRLDDIAFIEPEIDAEMANTRVIPGDTLLNITGASLGRCCIMPANHDLANVNQHVCIVRPRKDIIDPHFLYFTMCSHPLQSQIFANENGTSREGLNFEQVSNLLIPFPPGIIEQQAIIGKVITNIQKMDINIAKIIRSIDLLREYRTALISAAVTGKIDLREEVPVS